MDIAIKLQIYISSCHDCYKIIKEEELSLKITSKEKQIGNK